MSRKKYNINYKVLLIVFLIIDIILFINVFFYHEIENIFSNKNVLKFNNIKKIEDTTDYIVDKTKVAELKEELKIYKQEIVPEMLKTGSGDDYSIIGKIKINKINLEMQISSKTTDELMKTYACRLWGPNVNKKGNLCIIGHNWRNTKLFSKVPTLEVGDKIQLIDLNDRVIEYTIYDKYIVNPDDVSCLNQETNGEKIVTLITCTNDSTQRYIMHAK